MRLSPPSLHPPTHPPRNKSSSIVKCCISPASLARDGAAVAGVGSCCCVRRPLVYSKPTVSIVATDVYKWQRAPSTIRLGELQKYCRVNATAAPGHCLKCAAGHPMTAFRESGRGSLQTSPRCAEQHGLVMIIQFTLTTSFVYSYRILRLLQPHYPT